MCFPLNCIPCFLSGGDEKQTFTTAGYFEVPNKRAARLLFLGFFPTYCVVRQ
jgi:hypothetical protein